MNSLDRSFFERSVHEVARDLIGCELAVGETAGVIVETEAYDATDPACHAYIGKTARNEVLFGPPGRAYVYLSYGIHSLLNAVAEPEGSAAAVLIRALEPTEGIELMRARRAREPIEDLCSGPGKLTEALAVGLPLNGANLLAPPFEICGRAPGWNGRQIVAAPRIGITKAAELPWRYCASGSRHVSRPWPALPAERAA
ncbi:MAG TPA: DNA-3-methyladenine glycosylase [Solirubrobacterales bacterium]|nr:DNA-3-methyladenine glycosylase [Solirubrobacterales bacterium]